MRNYKTSKACTLFLCNMETRLAKLTKQTHLIGHLEGISFLVLLGIAMPLKYMMEMPKAVTIVGMLHGVLFVAFAFMLYRMFDEARWSIKKCFIAFLLSFVPFGTFFLHKLK
jgi:integral membrane protein